jgi:cytochrome P450
MPTAYFNGLQEDQLMVTDPKALQRMFTSGYLYQKAEDHRVLSQILLGLGVAWAEGKFIMRFSTMSCNDVMSGDDHKRHRKVLVPAFGAPESKAFLTIFARCAESVSSAVSS